MAEFLVILDSGATSEQMGALGGAILARGGKITHRYPARVLIVEGDETLADSLGALPGIHTVSPGPVSKPEKLGLDPSELLGVLAWNQRQDPAYKSDKASRPDEGQPWDFHANDTRGCDVPVEDAGAPTPEMTARAAPTNTSRYMIGTVAVGVVIVDGPAGGSAAFTAAEQTNVAAEVQEGATNLVGMAPAGANLNFIYDVNTVTLTLDPATVAGEQDWRDPAMTALGYGTGSAGMYDYLHDLRTKKWPSMCPGPDWAYIAFFTKYNMSWFAYASVGGPRLAMQYSNDGWGSNQIDRVFAHESGHIFGAADEYSGSSCNTGGSWGYLGVANGNCAVGNPGSVDCIMKANTYNVCQFTTGQFGWRDTDADGMPDPIDLSPGTYAADVGVQPGAPFYNNADLWVRNQDDGEAVTTHENPESNIDNFIYARVRNFGGVNAEVVRTSFYLANFTGTEFVYPNDYTNLITANDTPCPTIFSLNPGGSALTKVRLRPAQIPPSSWHPCLLVHVSTVQESSPPAGSNVWQNNALAQKNMVIDYVAPGATLSLPVVLKNVNAQEVSFEVLRKKVPVGVGLELQFERIKIKPEVVTLPIDPIFRPRPFGFHAEGITTDRGVLLRFTSESDVLLDLPERETDLELHLAAGSVMKVRSTESPPPEAAQGPAMFDREDRVILPLRLPVTRFKLPLERETRVTTGVSITAPGDARLGDEYSFDLVQYDEKGQVRGGIAFVVRVVSRVFQLRKLLPRVGVLRELSRITGDQRFGDSADATESLIQAHLSGAEGGAADVTGPRDDLVRVTAEITNPDTWGYPVGALASLSPTIARSGSLAVDLDAMTQLMFHAQERLLVT